MSWSTLAWSPTETHRAALVALFHLLIGVVAAVLAVAALTITSIFVWRTTAREGEVAVRRAVGGSRRHLLGAALCEGGVIATSALVTGLALGTLGARLALESWPGEVGPGTPVASVLGALATLGVIILGTLLPVVFLRRRTPISASSGKPFKLIVPALQLGLSLTVLMAAAVLERGASRLTLSDRGSLDDSHVVELVDQDSQDGTRAAAYGTLLRELRTDPTSPSVILTSPGTLVGLGMVDLVTTDCGHCLLPWMTVHATHYLVSSNAFRALGLSMVSGRSITDADGWTAPRVAVVNRALAAHYFLPGKAVGRGILIGRGPPEWHTVVGIVDDQQPLGFGGGLQPPYAVYLSVLQHPAPWVDLLVSAPADARIGAVMQRAWGEGLGTPATHLTVVRKSDIVAAEATPLVWFERMLSVEGHVLLALGTLGTFVIMQLWVASLRGELGLRRAVGARPRDIRCFISSRAVFVALGGVAIGLWVSLFVWDALAPAVPGAPPWDLHAALQVSPLLAGAALTSALLAAWRLSRATPATLLSAESG
jgi:putative ABC transport system permease protein